MTDDAEIIRFAFRYTKEL